MNAKQRRKWRRMFFIDMDKYFAKFHNAKWNSVGGVFIPVQIAYKDGRVGFITNNQKENKNG